MKKLLFILFFPITVPIYLFCKIAIWFFQWFGETFIPFLLNKIFPAIKSFIQAKSAEMEKNAEKIKQDKNKVLCNQKYSFKQTSNYSNLQNSSISNNSSTKTEIDKLFKEYSYKYCDINYEKQSKIVSIFTDKWRKLCQQDFVVLDFETTGLSYLDDRIIEIAAIRYKNCVETEKFVYLVNPLMPIPTEATKINNITDEMVADADTERYLIPQLIEFLSNSLIVAHNANFDLHFLEVAAQRCGYNVKYNYIDTISVSKKIFPGLENYKLSTIATGLGFNIDCLHRAENDVKVCAEIIKIALDSQ